MTREQPTASTRRSTITGTWLLLLLAGFPAGACRQGDPATSPAAAEDGAPSLFTEITTEVGLRLQGGSWPDGRFAPPELIGGGIGLFDYDGDGDLDLLHVLYPPPDRPLDPAPNRFYEQQPDGSFLDVTERSGLGDPGYGQGVAVGDADNDGDLDVYVANFGPDTFYLNQADGTFVESTARAGFTGDLWTSTAAFCDYDRDGDLDLYAVHYLRYRHGHKGTCPLADGLPDYCPPKYFDGVPDTLYRNNGDGTFTDVTVEARIILPEGGKTAKGLGVVCSDLTGDGEPDIFVANDGEANQLWVNRGDGTFSEQGIMRGVAVNRHGNPEASMGVTVGDVERDGRLDLYMTHLTQENNRLYCGGAQGLYTDRSVESRLATYDLAMTGFGCGFFDYDHDGDLDIAVVNGRVYRGPVLPGAQLGDFWNLYAEPNFLFENDGSGVFSDASPSAGSFATRIEVSRGLAFGDLDNDGDVDLVLTNADTSLRVFRNDAPRAGNHWLEVRALTGQRDAVGARIRVIAGSESFLGLILPSYSYQASNDPRAHFGLGKLERVDRIEITWPDGRRERFGVPGVDRLLTLEQGRGEAP